jgi:hypothetical protein
MPEDAYWPLLNPRLVPFDPEEASTRGYSPVSGGFENYWVVLEQLPQCVISQKMKLVGEFA